MMTNSANLDVQSFSLTYLAHFEILDEREDLNEPSGLTLSHDEKALWTISDDTKKIFKLRLDGELMKDESFNIPDKELEGIVLDPTGEFLLTVKEPVNEIIKIKIDSQEVVERKRLNKMAGYDAVKGFFDDDDDKNKGLEGITWNEKTDTIFVMKERDPGLLVEVSSDLQMILSHQLLNGENGFHDNDVESDEIDFSDICYDESRDRFWIVSDRARRLFLYDWNSNRMVQSSTLGYGENGGYREIFKAEGVVIDPDINRLYVVSDVEARLYVFDIRE